MIKDKVRLALLTIFISSFILTGCSIKENDTTPQKVLKHTVNTPLYVVIAVGGIAHVSYRLVLIGVLTPPVATYRYLTKDEDETELPKTKVEIEKN